MPSRRQEHQRDECSCNNCKHPSLPTLVVCVSSLQFIRGIPRPVSGFDIPLTFQPLQPVTNEFTRPRRRWISRYVAIFWTTICNVGCNSSPRKTPSSHARIQDSNHNLTIKRVV